VLLSHQIIPPKDFIPLFDAPPYNVIEGHVSALLLELQVPALRPKEIILVRRYQEQQPT
jgi:hypothetical protein